VATDGPSSEFKVRFGFTCRGSSDLDLEQFPVLVDDLERLEFDSIWIPEAMLNGSFDPLVALAYAAARTERLKIGTHLVLPGRSPVRIARELANLDVLSRGRLLLIIVLGLPDEPELLAQGVEKSQRGALMEELLPLLRRLWSGETVDHDGPNYVLRGASVEPVPFQKPLEMWLGGQVPAALRRAGRLGDGWIPGLITPAEAAAKRVDVEAAASAAGRLIDREHFGVNLAYSRGPMSDAASEGLRRRRVDLDPAELVPSSTEMLHQHIDRWIEAGFSKFLLRPVDRPASWTGELELLAEEVLWRQT